MLQTCPHTICEQCTLGLGCRHEGGCSGRRIDTRERNTGAGAQDRQWARRAPFKRRAADRMGGRRDKGKSRLPAVHSCRGRALSIRSLRVRRGAELSVPDRQDHRPQSRRRHGRCPATHRRRCVEQRLEAGRRYREQARSGRQCGCRVLLARSGRRLHAAGLAADDAGDQPVALQEAQLRSDQVQADHGSRQLAQRADRQPQARRIDGEGADRESQGRSRRHRLRLAGHRRHLAPDDGAVRDAWPA